MRIGVKYCGGCNPRFERSSIVGRLRRDFPNAEIASALHGPAAVIALVCGCPAAGASAEGLTAPGGVFTLTCPEDYDDLRRRIADAVASGSFPASSGEGSTQ